ncbi:putative transcriptional regulator, xre family [Streptomyces graminofaciens]|uniref:Transcriptional regulator, xre family n=1 Tax=Streptomyces graminofaciens TaxID=68212 RepID=A0ABN5V7D1_9ACTN|nr:putative transcriptional regulator, xre family [Streptomyces graminofaciens]
MTLARLRNALEWTFDELAGLGGLARRTLIDLEHGRAVGTVTTWHALAHAFDVPIEELLGSLCDDHTPPGTKGA